MINEDLFFKLCKEYGIELVEGRGMPLIEDNGIVRELSSADIDAMLSLAPISYSTTILLSDISVMPIKLDNYPYTDVDLKCA